MTESGWHYRYSNTLFLLFEHRVYLEHRLKTRAVVERLTHNGRQAKVKVVDGLLKHFVVDHETLQEIQYQALTCNERMPSQQHELLSCGSDF